MSGPYTVTTALQLVLLPALTELFDPTEIDATTVQRVGPDVARPVPTSRSRGIYAVVWINGERFEDLIVDEDSNEEMSDSDLVDRLVGNLEDFIAESQFGWGTRRVRRLGREPGNDA
jgi:hypothetical protein